MSHEEQEMLILTFYHAMSCFSITTFVPALKHGVICEQVASVAGLKPAALRLYSPLLLILLIENKSIYTVSVSHSYTFSNVFQTFLKLFFKAWKAA